MLQGLVGALPV
nr:unnamed protein product [Callosobruchus chinensis]